MNKFTPVLNRYLFQEKLTMNLGILRVCLCAFTLIWENKLAQAAFSDTAFYSLHKASPFIEFLKALLHPLISQPGLLKAVYLLTGICSMVGLFTRPALILYGLITTYITGTISAHGTYNHEHSLSSQIIMILALVPGSTNFSVDKLIRGLWSARRKGQKLSMTSLLLSPSAVWGIRLICIVLGLTYFTAGFSKLRYGGLEWLNGSTLRYYLDGRAGPSSGGPHPVAFVGPTHVDPARQWRDGFGIYAYTYGNRQAKPAAIRLGRQLAASPFMISLISVATVLFELLGLVLIAPRGRNYYLFGALVLHTSIGFLMGLSFWEYRVICVCMMDYGAIYGWFRRRLPVLIPRRLQYALASLNNRRPL